jgi:hypothetical protein
MCDVNQERYVKSLETYIRQLEEEIQDYQVLLGVFYMPVEDYTPELDFTSTYNEWVGEPYQGA